MVNKNLFFRTIYCYYNIFIRNYKYLFKKNSQFSEDKVIEKLFKNNFNGKFVDIGCFHPTRDNNTYRLYRKGWRGINIDLNPLSIDLFKILRSKDININAAISSKNKTTKFFFKGELSPLNTLDKNQLNFFKSRFLINKNDFKEKIIKTIKINDVLEKYKYQNIDFMSIDVEGLEYEIIKSINLKRYNINIFCIEILKHNKKSVMKCNKLINYLKKKNYLLISKTPINYFFRKDEKKK